MEQEGSWTLVSDNRNSVSQFYLKNWVNGVSSPAEQSWGIYMEGNAEGFTPDIPERWLTSRWEYTENASDCTESCLENSTITPDWRLQKCQCLQKDVFLRVFLLWCFVFFFKWRSSSSSALLQVSKQFSKTWLINLLRTQFGYVFTSLTKDSSVLSFSNFNASSIGSSNPWNRKGLWIAGVQNTIYFSNLEYW